MKKRTYNIIVTILLAILISLAFVPVTRVLAENSKDVWIDNTVDNSRSMIEGKLIVTDTATGEVQNKTIVKDPFSVTFSNPKTEEVSNAISDLKTELYSQLEEIVEGRSYNVVKDCEESEYSNKVWDNRKYETIEDDDAVLVGDTEYMGNVEGETQGPKTHIASGDYGKETIYTITLEAEYSSEEVVENTYSILDGANQTINEGEDLIVTASGDVEKLQTIVVDDEIVLTEEDCMVEQGSTIATIFSKFLSTLELDVEHALSFIYQDGFVDTTFKIAKVNEVEEPTEEPTEEPEKEPTTEEKETNNPKTGDNIIISFVVLGVALVGTIVTTKLIISKKD